MLGLDISKLRLYAFTNGAMAAIPFQIDECSPQGRLVCPQGTMMRRGYYNPDLKDILDTTIHYVDDLTFLVPPEAYPGQLGHASVNLLITRVKPGIYTFNQQWYYPHHFYPLDMEGVQRYMNIQNHPLVVRVK